MNNPESFKKLQGADPLRSQLERGEPVANLTRLEAKAEALIQEPADAPAEVAKKGAGSAVSLQKFRRRRSWLGAAAVVAGLILTGGGYLAGSGGLFDRGDTSAADAAESSGTEEFVTTSALAGGAESENREGEDAVEAAAPEMAAPEIVAEDYRGVLPAGSFGGVLGGPAEFTWRELSAEPGTATAYTYDSDAFFGEEILQTVAQAVGVTGDVESFGDLAMYGSSMQMGEYPSTVVRIERTATTSLSIESFTDLGAGRGEDSAPAAPAPAPAPTPSDDDARAHVQEVFNALGVDTAQWKWEFYSGDPGLVQVTGTEPLPSGSESELNPTGRSVTAHVTTQGLMSLHGELAPVVELGEYPIISEVAAVQRLIDPRFAGARISGPIADSDASVHSLATLHRAPPLLEPEAPFDWPLTEYEISRASLTVRPYILEGGATALLPTYFLTTDEGADFLMLALADDALNF